MSSPAASPVLSDSLNNHRNVVGLTASLLTLSTIAVALRFLARRKQSVPLLADDWVALIAWLIYLGYCTLTFWAVAHHHLGYALPHDRKQLPEALKAQGIISYGYDSMTAAAYATIKISALLFYRRVFCPQKGSSIFNIYLIFMVALIFCWMVIYVCLGVLQCGPKVWSLWTPSLAHNCKIGYPYLLSQAISDLLLEIIVLVTPIWSIYKLHTTTARRVGILLIFLTAFVGLGACIARLQTYVMLDQEKLHHKILDVQLSDTRAAYFCVLEGGLSLIAVNLPTLFFLRKHANPSKVLASVRSVLSLRSTDSQYSKGSRGGNSAHGSTKDDGRSSVSVKSLVPPETHWRGEVYSMPVLSKDEQRALATSPKTGISVLKSVDQRDNSTHHGYDQV